LALDKLARLAIIKVEHENSVHNAEQEYGLAGLTDLSQQKKIR
jgi:hypothetical protein